MDQTLLSLSLSQRFRFIIINFQSCPKYLLKTPSFPFDIEQISFRQLSVTHSRVWNSNGRNPHLLWTRNSLIPLHHRASPSDAVFDVPEERQASAATFSTLLLHTSRDGEVGALERKGVAGGGGTMPPVVFRTRCKNRNRNVTTSGWCVYKTRYSKLGQLIRVPVTEGLEYILITIN